MIESEERREVLRMHLTRFRLRTLLLAVTVVALLLAGGVTLHKRRQRFLAIASQHRVAEWFSSAASGMASSIPTVGEGPGVALLRLPDTMPGGVRAQSVFHAAMRVKYERAARYPWLPVEPDPPAPEGPAR